VLHKRPDVFPQKLVNLTFRVYCWLEGCYHRARYHACELELVIDTLHPSHDTVQVLFPI